MLPNLLIIGASKSGTTSLYNYLDLHPEIKMSPEKELNFFLDRFNWHKGVEWYESHFEGSAKIYGEASPLYTNYPRFKGTPRKISKLIPQVKLLYILRDPIQRLISHYKHWYAKGFESQSFQKAVSGPNRNTQLLACSKYYMQMEQFLEYFDASQIMVILLEDLKNYRKDTLRRVFQFLAVDPGFNSPDLAIVHNLSKRHRRKTKAGMVLEQTPVMRKIHQLPTQKRWYLEHLIYYPFSRPVKEPKLNDALRGELIDTLQEDVALLRKFTGYELDDWCV